METLLRSYYTWTDLLLAAVILYAVYALLLLLKRRLEETKRSAGVRATIYHFVNALLLLDEPITIVVLATIFVFISPVLHGTILALIVAAAFTRLRDYLAGRIILFNPLIAKGRRLRVDRFNGVINRISRVGLFLQTGEGLHFVNFSTLLTQGYSVVTGKEIGGFYQLKIQPREGDRHGVRDLANHLLTTPYLDRSFRPELSRTGGGIQARVSVREEQHLNELLALLAEWGYPATIAKR